MKKLFLCAGVISGCALSFFGYQSWNNASHTGEFKSAPVAVFPQKTLQTVHLPENKGIFIAYVDYKMIDGRRIKTASTSYWTEVQDSVIETASYYSNGFMKESQKAFPSSDGEAPLIRRHATYSDDGYFTSQTVNRKDGTCERIGQRLTSGDYSSRYFYADGKSLKRDRLFNPTAADPSGYRLNSEKVLRVNGSLEHEIFLLGDSYVKRVFNEEGKRVESFEMSFSSGLSGQLYDQSGYLLVSFKSNPYQSGFEAEFYKGNKRIQSRNSRGYSFTDTYYGEDDQQIVYQQFWRMIPGEVGEAPKPELKEIHVYKENQVAKIFEVEKGQIVRVKTTIDKQLVLVKYLDEKGFVVRSETKKGNEVVAFDIPDVVSEQEQIASSWLERITPVDVEAYTFKDPGSPPWLYDYEDTRYKGVI